MDNNQALFLDLVHDTPITGLQTFKDARTIEFRYGKEEVTVDVAEYFIVDGKLRVFLVDSKEKANLTEASLAAIGKKLANA